MTDFLDTFFCSLGTCFVQAIYFAFTFFVAFNLALLAMENSPWL